MRFFSPLLILVALLAAACGGAAVLPDEFTRERADGKIPVSIPLIREQTEKEIDGMPEGQAKAERWQLIEADYNTCRLSSSRNTKAEADKIFADCMSRKGYLYMHRLDAEQLHNDIAEKVVAEHKAAERAEEEARLVAKKKAEEERVATQLKKWQDRKDYLLRRASYYGNVEGVRFWLGLDANPNAARDDGGTALMWAAEEGYSEIAKMLLDAGANPNAAQNDGKTVLMWATEGGYLEIAKILLAVGANPNAAIDGGGTALIWAAEEGYSEIAKMLLDAGANPNAATDDGWTSLMLAADKSYAEVAKTLLAAGANPNAVADGNQTALMAAARKNHAEVAKTLLANGANPNVAKDNGWTALIMTAIKGYPEVAKALLDAGANPNAMTDSGRTALMQAAYEGHAEVAKILLDAGANLNAVDKSGWTALIVAASKENLKIVRVLLWCGANPSIKNNNGADAWFWAERHPIILPVFRQYQAKIASGWLPQSCKDKAITTAAAPNKINSAAEVFENAWRNIVVVRQGEKQGSGVIVRPNVVATNCHVIDSGGDIVIYKHDNRRATTDTTYNAIVRKRDTARDFCLLNVAGLQGTPAKLRRYSTLDIGEDVYAVGSPRGLDLSLSSGIISQLRQGKNTRYIQTDASVSPGSSGGGLFDSVGNLIGILTAKIADEDVEGIGFAIPADLADNL